MKNPLICLAAIFVLLSTRFSDAGTLYVDLKSANPTPPYSDWSIAATNIQDAIDASSDGDKIWVTNGVYQTGGKVMAGDLTNRVALNKAVTVQSVNGPFVTTIAGIGATNGPIAVRCAWLTNNAALIGFTLTRGATRTAGDDYSLGSGGGIWCASSNTTVRNCVIVSNTAMYYGGGAYQGTLNSCLIRSNASFNRICGAVYSANLNNCTVVSNAAYGVVEGSATNSVVYYNYANSSAVRFSYSCTTPMGTGTGNFTNAPLFFLDGFHLLAGSPCIGAGTTPVTSADILGNAWANPPSVGCTEAGTAILVTRPQTLLTSAPIGFTIGNALLSGAGPFTFAWLKDGVLLQDDGHFAFTQTSNLVATNVSFSDAGNYQLVVGTPSVMTTSAVAQVVIHCVNIAGINPAAPYTSWATAATNIQDAITIATANEIVLVTNGVYATGGKSMDNIITNRVSIDKAILVQSVNGPDVTTIQGTLDPATTNGPGAMRCVWMTNNSILKGFTVQNGATRSSGLNQSRRGGGVSGTTNAVVENCLILKNYASYVGGGVYFATLNSCTLAGNHAVGSGTAGSGSAGDGSGGGAANSRLNNCLVLANFAEQWDGGGAQYCSSTNSAFIGNFAGLSGSGVSQGTHVNCTIVNNTCSGYGGWGGAAANATLINCIVYSNRNLGPGPLNYYLCNFSYSDSDPLPTGTGNIDTDPLLLADNIHLVSTSPCIGAGIASNVSGIDIDNQSWNGPPSIGCDEWQPMPLIAVQPVFQVGTPSRRVLTFNAIAAGLPPFAYFWFKDGTQIADNAHYGNSTATNLVVKNFQPEHAGLYQLIVSNSYGMVTSQVAQVIIHAVDAAGANPIAPYSDWQTAATTIQDAIDAAVAGEIVLVTNGVYATGGKVMFGDLTNRVALDKALTVISVNGYSSTVIEGQRDAVSTNGPGAVRCAWLAPQAALNGFTLRDGATRGNDSTDELGSGGGALLSSRATIWNCVLTNNCALNCGGGVAFGQVNNSFICNNTAQYGGGAYLSWLYNCTVTRNHCFTSALSGAGTCSCVVRNCIVVNNYLSRFGVLNYSLANDFSPSSSYSYSCTSPSKGGVGTINLDPKFLDSGFRLTAASPCRGAGSAVFATGNDLDEESFASPPSMGCDEIIDSNLIGPISASISQGAAGNLVNHFIGFNAIPVGRVATESWLVSDGATATNTPSFAHIFTNAGTYTVTFTVYNTDYPAGVSTNLSVNIDPLNQPSLQPAGVVSNLFQFSFDTQYSANYTVQYATNLIAPITWQTLQTFYFSTGGVMTIQDPGITNDVRFYRVQVQ